MNPLPSVQDILPHKAPMVLIDSLVSVGDDSVHCRATIEHENLFFDPAINAVPGWVGLEIMAQSVAAWAGFHAQKANLPPQVGFLLGSRAIRRSGQVSSADKRWISKQKKCSKTQAWRCLIAPFLSTMKRLLERNSIPMYRPRKNSPRWQNRR